MQFSANGSFGPLLSEINKVNSSLTRLSAAGAGLKGMDAKLADVRANFLRNVEALNAYDTKSMAVKSSTQQFTDSLVKQDLTMGRIWKNRKLMSGQIDELINNQMRLRKATAMSWRRDMDGNIYGDLIVPREVEDSIGRARMRLGILSQMAHSAATNMVKFGKNMQWAGRQLTVGLSLPLILAGSASIKAARDIDAQMVRLRKVYGDTANVAKAELDAVSAATRETASQLARSYGIMSTDTVELAAEFAAAGYTGKELQGVIRETSRIMTLGEIDRQTAMDATIAIQSTFRLNNDQLADSFNRLNAIENQTTISTEDLLKGMPRAAGVIAQLGGSVEYLAALLAGMRERGVVDVLRASTAIRTSMGRIIDPTKETIEKFQGLLDIQNLYSDSGGNVQKTLENLASFFGTLDPEKAIDLATNLFGAQRYNEMLLLMESIRDTGSAYAKSLNVMGMSSVEVSQIAQNEITEITESASGKFRRLMATIKDEVAKAGEPIINLGNAMLGALVGIIKWFNDLPGTVKKSVFILGFLAALVGPVVMLVGLFTNFAGQIAVFASMLGKMATRFGLVTAEQRLSEIAAKSGTIAINNEALAMQGLSKAINTVSRDLGIFIRQQRAAQGLPAFSTATPRARGADGKFISNAAVAAAATKKQADEAARAKRNMAGMATGLASVVGLMTLMSGSTSTWVNLLGFALMSMSSIVSALKQMNILQGINNMLTRVAGIQGMGKMATSASRVLGSLSAAVPHMKAALVVATAAAAAWMVWRNQMKGVKEEFQNINNAAKSMADIIGFQFQEGGKILDPKTGEIVDSVAVKTRKWTAANKDAAEELRGLNNEGLKLRAIEIGLDARRAGATAAQAMEAVQIALKAGGNPELIVDVTAEINFESPGDAAEKEAEVVAHNLWRAFNNKFKQGKMEGLGRVFSGDNQLNTGALEMVDKVVNNIYDVIAESPRSPESQAAFANLENGFVAQYQKIFDSVELDSKDREILIRGGIDPDDTMSVVNYMNSLSSAERSQMGFTYHAHELANSLEKTEEAERRAIKTMAKRAGLSDDEIEDIRTIEDLRKKIIGTIVNVTDAERAYDAEVERRIEHGEGLSEAQQLEILNLHRLSAGLAPATTLMQGFGNAAEDAAKKIVELTDDQQALLDGMQDYIGVIKESITSGLDAHVEMGLDMFDAATDAHLDSLEKQEDDLDDSYDKREDTMEKAHDKVLDNLEKEKDKRLDALKAAQDADDKAQRHREEMFRREQMRLERLATSANSSADFNVALAEGNLDEAARVMEVQSANVAKWALEDSETALKSAYEARKEARDQEIDDINKVYDARVEAIKKTQDAEKEALAEQKKIDNDRFKSARDTYRRIREAQRDRLEAELEATMLFMPRNEAEYNKLVTNLAAVFDKYGGGLKVKNAQWSKTAADGWQAAIRQAREKVLADEQWKAFGESIVQKATQGALGMGLEDFFNWMITGKVPAKVTNDSTYRRGPGGPQNTDIYHSGGIVGGSTPKGLKPGEVPAILQTGEYVIDRSTVNKFGPDYFRSLQQGQAGMDETGRMHDGGLAEVMGMGVGAALNSAITAAINFGAARKNAELSAQGRIGDMVGAALATGGNLGAFMAAIRDAESGGNYGAVNKHSGARGAYQIMPANWPSWSAQAGLGQPAAWSQANQDRVASHIMQSYYNKYGSWQAVAAGWYGGGRAANKYMADPNDPYLHKRHGGGLYPSIMDYVNKIMNKMGMFTAAAPGAPGLGLQEPDRFAPWLTAVHRQVNPSVLSRVGQALGMVPGGQQIISGFRPGAVIKGTNRPSLHATGRAVDIGANAFSPVESAMGDQIARLFRSGTIPGVREVLWKTMQGGNHFDHVHVGFYHKGGEVGGMKVPGLMTGGNIRYDNTIANLHKGERVLTAPLTSKLDRGLSKLDNAGNSAYTVHIHAAPGMDENALANAVVTKIQKMEMKKGSSRVVK